MTGARALTLAAYLNTLRRTLHGKTPITPQLALRLEQAGISTAEMWLKLQAKYDLWQLRQKPQQAVVGRLDFARA